MCVKKYCVLSVSKTHIKKRTDTLNSRPSKFFLLPLKKKGVKDQRERRRRDLKKKKDTPKKLCSFVQRENPFFFHLFHRLKDTRRKEKEKRERERQREGHTKLGREGRLRERETTTTTTREENVEWTKIIIIHYYYILGF